MRFDRRFLRTAKRFPLWWKFQAKTCRALLYKAWRANVCSAVPVCLVTRYAVNLLITDQVRPR